MKLDPIKPLIWPPSHQPTEAAIGRFVIAWGVLEGEIDDAIKEILCLDTTTAGGVTANLGTKAKIEIFLSTFYHESELFPESLLETANKLGHDTASASGVYRNWVAHGRPILTADEKYEHLQWIWSQPAARKGGIKHSISALTPHIFDNHTIKVKSISERWHQLRISMRDGLEKLYFIRRHDGID
jgi:hypothetical protein